MKIIVHNHQTTIYANRNDQYLLTKTIKSIKSLEYYDIVWANNKFIIKYLLTEYHKTKILDAFKEDIIRR